MIGFIETDGGRAKAGYEPIPDGDCLVRAIAILTGEDYHRVFSLTALTMAEHGYLATGDMSILYNIPGKICVRDVQYLLLERMGFHQTRFRFGYLLTYSQTYRKYGDCIAISVDHASALKGGVMYDTEDRRTIDTLECEECKVTSVWRRNLGRKDRIFNGLRNIFCDLYNRCIGWTVDLRQRKQHTTKRAEAQTQ